MFKMVKSLFKTIKKPKCLKIKGTNKSNLKIIQKQLNYINKDSDLFNINVHLRLNLSKPLS